MRGIKAKHLVIAGCVIIVLLLCCGVASCVADVGPGASSVDFDHDKSKKKKSTKSKKGNTSKKRSMEVYETVVAGHFHTRNCITCHG